MKMISRQVKWLILLSAALCMVLGSCSIGPNVAAVLPNGVTIDQATKDKLIALTPKFEALVKAKTQSAKASPNQPASAEPLDVQAARELLLQEFGEKGLDYLIMGEYGQEVVEVTPSAPPGTESKYLAQAGYDGTFRYYIFANARWATFPWGSHNWADTSEEKFVASTGTRVNCQCALTRSTIVDSVTPSPGNFVQEPNHVFLAPPFESWVTAFGNYLGGFFPPKPTGIHTWHQLWDGVLTGGYAIVEALWG